MTMCRLHRGHCNTPTFIARATHRARANPNSKRAVNIYLVTKQLIYDVSISVNE